MFRIVCCKSMGYDILLFHSDKDAWWLFKWRSCVCQNIQYGWIKQWLWLLFRCIADVCSELHSRVTPLQFWSVAVGSKRRCQEILPSLIGHVVFMMRFLAATKQLYEWFSPSVRPCLSVRLSVTPFWLCSHHPIIMKLSGVITSDKSDVHAKGQGQRSRSQRSQPNFTVSGL